MNGSAAIAETVTKQESLKNAWPPRTKKKNKLEKKTLSLYLSSAHFREIKRDQIKSQGKVAAVNTVAE